MYINLKLKCENCKKIFILTGGEQEYQVSLGNKELPKFCDACEGKENLNFVEREVFCTRCGKGARVFFAQSDARPILCFDCMSEG